MDFVYYGIRNIDSVSHTFGSVLCLILMNVLYHNFGIKDSVSRTLCFPHLVFHAFDPVYLLVHDFNSVLSCGYLNFCPA